MSYPPSGFAAPQPSYPYPPPPPPYAAPPPAPRPSSGLAVAALVIALLALLGAAGLTVWAVGQSGETASGSDDSRHYPLTGQVGAMEDGVGHATLGREVSDSATSVIEAAGGRVDKLECPAVLPGKGIVSVCHGTVDDEEWAVVVFFEDNDGHYTLDLI